MKIREEKRARQLENILNAAIHTFANCVYDQAKIEQIARLAKVGKGTIYNYFKTKKELFFAVQREILKQLFHVMIFESDSDVSPTQEIEAVLHKIYGFFQEKPDRYAIFVVALYSFPELCAFTDAEVRRPIYNILAPKLNEKVSKGLIHTSDANIEDITMSLFGMINPFLHNWFCSPETYDFASKIPFIAKIFIYGILSHDQKK